MLTGIVIDARDVAGMRRFWSSATRGRTDGLHLRFMPTTHPKAARKNRRCGLDAGGNEYHVTG